MKCSILTPLKGGVVLEKRMASLRSGSGGRIAPELPADLSGIGR